MSRRREVSDYRDTVLLYLHRQGLHAATSPELADLQGIPLLGKSGVINGLPWTITARFPRAELDLSSMVNQANDLATHFGTTDYAAVFHRKGHRLGSAYALTTVDVLAAAINRDLSRQESAA